MSNPGTTGTTAGSVSYRQIYSDLREEILKGKVRPGLAIPSIRELAAKYGVSPKTIQAATNLLKAEGLLTGRTGQGLYVANPIQTKSIASRVRAINSLYQALTEGGYKDCLPGEGSDDADILAEISITEGESVRIRYGVQNWTYLLIYAVLRHPVGDPPDWEEREILATDDARLAADNARMVIGRRLTELQDQDPYPGGMF
jgi:Transcriptional regulators